MRTTNFKKWTCGHIELTILRNNSEGDNIASILDELNNVIVRELDDGASIDRWDTISHMQQATAVGGTAFDDSANFVRDNWKGRNEEKKTLKPHVLKTLKYIKRANKKRQWPCSHNTFMTIKEKHGCYISL